jgi:hypothetical protein
MDITGGFLETAYADRLCRKTGKLLKGEALSIMHLDLVRSTRSAGGSSTVRVEKWAYGR